MEELFLRVVFAAEKLDVIDHQHIDGTELFLECHGVLVSHGPNELIHELLGGEVDDPSVRVGLADVPGDSVHQMRLAQSDPAIQEQRIERNGLRFADTPRRSECQLVRFADNEILETEPWIERRPDLLAVGLALHACRLRHVYRRRLLCSDMDDLKVA